MPGSKRINCAAAGLYCRQPGELLRDGVLPAGIGHCQAQ